MRIGIPKEIKTREGRVGLIAPACAELRARGHQVFLEQGAGLASGYSDAQYLACGATLVADAATLYQETELIVKVKEPQPEELLYLRPDHLLFSYLHLAAAPALCGALLATGLTAVAFETVADAQGNLPLLAPMSVIAGRLAVQIGSHLLHQPAGGKGLLLGGLSGTERGRVVIIGAGHAGGGAAALAAALGAQVTVFDTRADRLATMQALGANVSSFYPYPDRVHEAVRQADLLIGAVLITGARAPKVVSKASIEAMEAGSVVMDIAIDQGGCIETARPTTYADPTYLHQGIIHFGVTNIPGAVPRTASQALSLAILPSVLALANGDWQQDAMLRGGINVQGGKLIHPALRNL